MTALCISPVCGNKCDQCNSALTPEQVAQYAMRYAYLRDRDLDAIVEGGVFAGLVPDNLVLNGSDLDAAIDKALHDARRHLPGLFDDMPADSHFC